MREDWSGEVAVVTGAAGSIGAATLDHLGGLGARVAGSDRTAQPSRSERRRMDAIDVRDRAAVDGWVASVSAEWGCPTIGVVCAGITRAGRLSELSESDWRDVVAVNLDGAFHSAQTLIRRMIADGIAGRIVFVGSWAAHAPHPHIGAYSASKAALRALCRTLALDHARDGILVNEVAPGIVNAGLSRQLFETDEDLATRTRAAIPLGRLIEPEDVARDVAFLASPLNRHTTGAVLVSDGGLSLASVMNPGRD